MRNQFTALSFHGLVLWTSSAQPHGQAAYNFRLFYTASITQLVGWVQTAKLHTFCTRVFRATFPQVFDTLTSVNSVFCTLYTRLITRATIRKIRK